MIKYFEKCSSLLHHVLTPASYLLFVPNDIFGTSKVVLTGHSFRNYDKIRALHKGSFNNVISCFVFFV